jgi:hypothetical protein
MPNAITLMQRYNAGLINETTLIELLHALKNTDFQTSYEHKSLISYALTHVFPDKCASLIDALLRRAMHDKASFAYLLTAPNEYGLSPYYHALCHHGLPDEVAQKLSEWLVFAVSMKFITKAEYANVHLTNMKGNQSPLHAVILGGVAVRVEMALADIQFALKNNWLSLEDVGVITHRENCNGQRAIDAAMSSSNPKIIELTIKHVGIDAFTPNDKGQTPFHLMSTGAESEALDICFIEMNTAIQRGQLPAYLYPLILFSKATVRKDPRNLLSQSFRFDCGIISLIILKHAEIARHNKWLDAETYQQFLLQHPLHQRGFTYLHEALRSSSHKNIYEYIGACLRAILNGDIPLVLFKEELLKVNKAGFSVFHQAVNHECLEVTELFLNLFNTILPESYDNVLHARKKREPRCDNAKPYAKEINALVISERHRMRRGQALIPNTVIRYRDHRVLMLDFLTLIDLMRAVAKKESPELDDIAVHSFQSPASIYRVPNSPCYFKPFIVGVPSPNDSSLGLSHELV